MPINYDKADGIATITLDNPPVNVFTPQLHKDLYGILTDFLADPSVKVGIWTATGERAMSAGDDIKSARPERSRAEVVERHLRPRRDDDPLEYPGWEHEVMKLERFKPIIGAVNGPIYGAGLLYLLLLTDIRLAVPGARFGFPEIAYGMGGAGGVTRLGRQIPHIHAMWMLNEIVAPEKLMTRAREVAGRIARHPAMAVRVEMEAYYRGLDMSRDEALAFSGHLYRLQRAVQDPTPPLAKAAAAAS